MVPQLSTALPVVNQRSEVAPVDRRQHHRRQEVARRSTLQANVAALQDSVVPQANAVVSMATAALVRSTVVERSDFRVSNSISSQTSVLTMAFPWVFFFGEPCAYPKFF